MVDKMVTWINLSFVGNAAPCINRNYKNGLGDQLNDNKS